MTRDDIEGLMALWIRERALPPADPEALAQVLLDALADHWDQTPQNVRQAVLAVAAVLRT